MDSLYQEIILDHYRNPVGRGLREPHEAEVHHVNPTCGDEITLRVHLAGTGQAATIEDISYDNQGCSISQASASVMSEMVDGVAPGDAEAVRLAFLELMHGKGALAPDEDVLGDGVAFVGVAKYPARIKCALLPWMALQDAEAKAGIGPQTEGNAG